MRKLSDIINVDLSDLFNYPWGRVKNNTGTGNGTPVNEAVYGDYHQTVSRLMRLYGIEANGLPDNVTNGFQIVDALRALASKNDFVLPLSVSSGVLSVPIKLNLMLEGEQVVCKAGFDLATQTQIKGSDNVTLAFTANGSFKTNEYVRLIKTSSGVDIVRLTDHFSVDSMVGDANYLKKANQTEENAGTIDTKATTPLTNLTAFIRRVIGADSGSYLATAIRNGLYPKEHFAIVAGLNVPKNIGFFTGFDVGGSVGSLTVGGHITSAVASSIGSFDTQVLVTVSNAMTNTNYYVRVFVEALQSDMNLDNDIGSPVFQPVSTTQFKLAFKDLTTTTIQNLKIHVEVVQY